MAWTGPTTFASRRAQPVSIDASSFVTGGTSPRTYTAAGLPAGLTMSSAGMITGTPTTLATYSPTVTVTDGLGATVTASLKWTVS
jgi:hypothetical protein